MSHTAYPQWPTPTAEPWSGTPARSDGQPITDHGLAALLEEMAAEGPGATESRTYATYHAEAVKRGMTIPVLHSHRSHAPGEVLELSDYWVGESGRHYADVYIDGVDGITSCCTEDLRFGVSA